jgi:hypothetical protein
MDCVAALLSSFQDNMPSYICPMSWANYDPNSLVHLPESTLSSPPHCVIIIVVIVVVKIKHKHGGFNINYEKATVVWQQIGSGL